MMKVKRAKMKYGENWIPEYQINVQKKCNIWIESS